MTPEREDPVVAVSDERPEPEHVDTAAAATRRQIRGSSVLMSGRIISLLANLLIQVLIVRALSVADYGVFAYALAFTTTARIVVTLGHNRTITRFLAIYEEERRYDKLFGTLVMEVLIIASVGVAITLGVWAFHDRIAAAVVEDPRALTVLLIVLLLAPVEALDDLVEGVFAVFARARAIFVRKYVLSPALRLTVVLALVVTGQDVVFLASGYLAASVCGVLIYLGLLGRLMRERGLLQHFDRRKLRMPAREVFSFSLPLLSTDLVVVSMNTVSVVLLGHFGGPAAVAGFRAIKPAAVLNQFIMRSFSLLFLPLASRLFARDDRAGIREAYWQTAVLLAVFTFPIFAMTFVFAEPMVVTLFGARYRSSAPYLSVLALGYYFNVALGFNALILQVFGRLKYLVAVNSGAAAANVGLSLLFIPRYGAYGVAVANCVTLVLQNVLNQAGLGRGIGVGVFSRSHMAVYGSIPVATGSLWAAKELFEPGIVLSVGLAALVSLALLAVNRSHLRLGETFPELRRVPLLGRIVG